MSKDPCTLGDNDTVPNIRQHGTLILVQYETVKFANSSATEKDVLVECWKNDGGKLLWICPGEWRSDLFELRAIDVVMFYRYPNSYYERKMA